MSSTDQFGESSRKLRDLRQTEKFCDVCLIISNNKIFAHRVILASSSEYFENLLHGPFLESKKMEIEIKEVNYEATSKLVDFMYTTKLDLNTVNVYEIYRTADLYQMNAAKQLCSTFLKSNVNKDNCLKIWSISKQYISQELERVTKPVIASNLPFLSNEPEFLDLSAEEVSELVAPYEKTADANIAATINWALQKPNIRMEFLINFLKEIPHDKISTLYLISELSTNEFILKDNLCMRWLLKVSNQKLQNDIFQKNVELIDEIKAQSIRLTKTEIMLSEINSKLMNEVKENSGTITRITNKLSAMGWGI